MARTVPPRRQHRLAARAGASGGPWRARPGWRTAIACVLVIAAVGYWSVYPQVRAAAAWRQAQTALASDDLTTARAQLRNYLEVSPESGEAHFLLARAARRADDPETMRRHWREAQRHGWVKEQIDLEGVLFQAQNGAVDAVETRLRALLERGHADEPYIVEALVRGCLQLNRAEAAYQWSMPWVDRFPQDWRAHLWHGRVLEAGLKPVLAADEYRRAVVGNSTNFDTRLGLAGALVTLREFAEAMPHAQAAVAYRPDDVAALLALARCQQAVGARDDAAVTLDHLLTIQPKSGAACYLRGQLALDDEDVNGAVDWLRKAEALDPYDTLTLTTLATGLRRIHKEADAEALDKKASVAKERQEQFKALVVKSQANPDDFEVRRQAALVLMGLERNEEAIRWLLPGLTKDRNHRPTRETLAECLKKLKDPTLESVARRLLADSAPSSQR